MELTLPDVLRHLSRSANNYFYALILNCFHRVEDERVVTMAVSIHDDKLVLLYSPSFLKKLSFHMACFVVKHEALHIVHDHIPRYLELLSKYVHEEERSRVKQVANIAMDLSINCVLRQDPDWWRVQKEFDGVLPEQYGLEKNQSFDWYLDALLKQPKVDSGLLLTLHDFWEPQSQADGQTPVPQKRASRKKVSKKKTEAATPPPSPPQETPNAPLSSEELQGLSEQLRRQIKGVVKQAMADMTKAGGSDIPKGLRQWLDQFTADPVVPWWHILTTRIHSARRTKPVRSIQRPNRRLLALTEEDESIIPAIGTAYDPSFRIFKVIDVSGSMSNEAVSIGFTETQALLRTNDDMEVRVMQGDDEIVSDQLFHGNDELPRCRESSGGTDFNAYFEYIWKNYMHDHNQRPDLVVIYTDGGTWRELSPERYLPPQIPVIWLLTRDGSASALEANGYGEVIFADRDQTRSYDK